MAKMAKKYPLINRALDILQNDSGVSITAGVMLKYADNFRDIEKALSKLNSRKKDEDGSTELDHFVIGDEIDQRRLRRRNPELRLADKFLNDVFEG